MSEYTARQILDMIETNGGPEGLDLSGKDLSQIDLSRETAQAELDRMHEEDPEAWPHYLYRPGVVNLEMACLESANLWGANLKGARLLGANLESANLWGAELEEANLRGANLKGANLRYANLKEASLGGAELEEANLRSAELEEANLRGAELKGTDLRYANLKGASLESANLKGASLESANLKGANLRDAELEEAIVGGANLEEAILWCANLKGASLGGAELEEAIVGGANLEGADLRGAKLARVDLQDTWSIKGVFFYRSMLGHTQLTKEQLGGAIGEELENKWIEAKEAYLALKNNFEQIGRYDDASWAYCKERRMEKRASWQKGWEAFGEHRWCPAIRGIWKAVIDQLVELACDYGEGIERVIATMLFLWIVFAILYGIFAGVWGPWQKNATGQIRYVTRNPVDLLLFSIGITSRMPVGLEARSTLVMHILMPIEALLGTALTGLLGFVLGNRIRRS
jgi:uncharacterized protein YjbI with pentapeptide repeats